VKEKEKEKEKGRGKGKGKGSMGVHYKVLRYVPEY
jgi:hypothetical protein